MPKTNMLLAYDVLNKQKLFTLYSVRASYGYSWKESINKEHVLNPINIQFVHPFDVTPQYNDSAAKYPTLRQAIEPQFIVGATYSYTYNPLTGRSAESGWYFNGNADVSGNAAGLVIGKNSDGKRAIFGYDFAQYIRLDADVRRYIQLGKNSVWASRVLAGFGLPYGNSWSLPFVKQYFVGGNNSIRAFRSMAVGPGTVSPPGIGGSGFYPNQTGDIKLEGNTEVRTKLFSIVHGAAFIDAGNVWLYHKDTARNAQPGGEFTKQFLKQLAVGAGVGLRFDISFLVLRLDLAIPLRIPYLPEGQRWVIDKIKFSDPQWRRENLIFNLAIGYPF
ncbi:MAG: BamA/TamA family outer membrane protein [Bacteroidetes bacterium]|nr:BamA/TamA family outer membrane protein [Bacteroidota bacterium]